MKLLPYPSSFEAFNTAFHALESATIGKDASHMLSSALHELGRAQGCYNDDAGGFAEEMDPSDIADFIANLNYYRHKLEGWQPMTESERESAQYLGPIEFEQGEEMGNFDVFALPDRLVFGNPSNACFLESGFYPLSPDSNLDECLFQLIEDLEAYYRSKGHVSIFVNERI